MKQKPLHKSQQRIRATRIGIVAGSILYSGFPFIYEDYLSYNFYTPLLLSGRFLLSLFGLSMVITSYVKQDAKKHLPTGFELLAGSMALHHLIEHAAVGSIFPETDEGVLTTLGAAAFAFSRTKHLYMYTMFSILGVGLLCWYLTGEVNERMSLFIHYSTLVTAAALMLGSKLGADEAEFDQMHQTIDGMKDQFLQVAHDVKSPLVLLAAQLKSLNSSVEDKVIKAKVAHLSSLNTYQTESVVGMLQDLRILTEKEAPRKCSAIEVADLWQSCCSNLHQGRHVLGLADFAWGVEGPKLKCFTNRLDLSRIFENLIKNAAHAIKGSGSITLKLTQTGSPSGPRLSCVVSNTHSQIAEEVLTKINSEHSVTTGEYGSGTGLRVVRVLVKRYGGSLHVSSSQDGVQVAFDLPLAAA